MLESFRSLRKFSGTSSPWFFRVILRSAEGSRLPLTLRVAKTATLPHQDSSPVAQNDTLKMFQLSRDDFALPYFASLAVKYSSLWLRLCRVGSFVVDTPPQESRKSLYYRRIPHCLQQLSR